MSDPVTALKIVPLAGEALKRYLALNEIGKLFRLIERDVHRHPLPPGTTDQVLQRLDGLRVDPTVAGALMALLDKGDLRVKDPLHKRLAELLVFDDSRLVPDELADIVVGTIEANLHRAKRNDREASHSDAQVTQAVVREELANLPERVASVVSDAGPRFPPASAAVRVGRALAALRPSQARIMEELAVEDPDGCGHLQEMLSAGGAERIAAVIDAPQAWLENGSAAVWDAAGRLADSIGQMAQAQVAYERAADHPAVSDRPRQLIRASNAAAAQGNKERVAELLDAARALDPENAAVLIQDARDSMDLQRSLEILDRVTPVDDNQTALAELVRAGALIGQGEFFLARDAISRAEELEVDGSGAAEMQAIADLAEAQWGLQDEAEPSPLALSSAAQQFVVLLNEAREQEQWDAASVHGARAIQAYALAGDTRAAGRLLDRALADQRLQTGSDAHRGLVQGALLLQRFTDVLKLVPDSGDEDDRLDRAAAQIMGGDAGGMGKAASELRELIESESEETYRAAFLLLCAAANDLDVEWDEKAARIVGAKRPSTAAFLHADRLAREGDLDGAEAQLRAYADQPNVLRFLIHLAERQGKLDVALRTASSLAQRTGAASDRLLLAALLAKDDKQDLAIERLLAVARDEQATLDERCMAYGRAANLLQEAARLTEVERLAREWAKLDETGNPRWMAVFALTLRFRHADALTAWHELGEPDPDTEFRALVLGEIFSVAAKPIAALEMLSALSDRYDRPENLEANLLFGALRLEHRCPSLPDILEARIRDTFETFLQRFPNSTRIRLVPVDLTDPAASLVAALGDELTHRGQHAATLAHGVRAGITAVPMLAASAGRSVGETLLRLRALPITFPDDQTDRHDRGDAATAYDAGAAIWDLSAIFVVAALGREVEASIRGALMASSVARATQQDAARDLSVTAEAERGEIAMINGVLQVAAWSEPDRQADAHRATEMLRLATDLPAQPLNVGNSEDEMAKLATSDAPLPIRSWAGTLAVARREGLAVYSDDRVVRRSAREIGLPTFGTLALADVLTERGVVGSSVRDKLRHRLLTHGSWGIGASVDELAQLGREADWQPTAGLRAALGDTSAWITLRARWAERVLGFLDHIAREAPEQLDRWCHRALDAMTEAIGSNYQEHAVLLLLVALNPLVDPARMSTDGLRALIFSLRSVPYFSYFRPPDDLLVMATSQLLAPFDDLLQRAEVFRRISDRLDDEDQALLRQRFVR